MKLFSSLSIFQNFKNSDLYLEPSPHIIIENCLDYTLYNKLKDSFPTLEDYENILKDSNKNDFSKKNYKLTYLLQ